MIEQAKGIVAERNRVGVDEAFQQIRQFARNHNRLLSETARQIIAGTLLPMELTEAEAEPNRVLISSAPTHPDGARVLHRAFGTRVPSNRPAARGQHR